MASVSRGTLPPMRRTMRSMPVIFTVLVGCNADLAPAVGWIAPFDGQTAVATSESLVLSMSGLKVPVDYPLNELVQVADLDRGGLVLSLIHI